MHAGEMMSTEELGNTSTESVESADSGIVESTQHESTPASTPTEKPAAATVESHVESPAAGSQKPVVVGATGETPAASAYTPKTKFKAGDVEHEIPKEFQGLMKDAASEKQVTEIFEKAYGLETVKNKLQSTRTERDKFQAEARGLTENIGELRNIYQKATGPGGNLHKLDQFFGKLDIPQDVILKYAYEKVKMAEMPPEQRQLIESQLQADQQAERFQKEAQQATSYQQQQMREMKAMQFESLMDKPDMVSIERAFDAARKPGAFRRAIVQQGTLAWHQTQENLTPAQAAQRVIEEHGLKAEQPGVTPGQATPGANGQSAVVQKTGAVIPNVQGRSASPLKAKPKNLDEVLKLRKERHGF